MVHARTPSKRVVSGLWLNFMEQPFPMEFVSAIQMMMLRRLVAAAVLILAKEMLTLITKRSESLQEIGMNVCIIIADPSLERTSSSPLLTQFS